MYLLAKMDYTHNYLHNNMIELRHSLNMISIFNLNLKLNDSPSAKVRLIKIVRKILTIPYGADRTFPTIFALRFLCVQKIGYHFIFLLIQIDRKPLILHCSCSCCALYL